jgi:hypothetical protein
MYETLMEAVVADENCQLALEAVVRNQGAAGIDRMTTAELESQQLLLRALTPIFDPQFSEHSYGFRPGHSAQGAMRALMGRIARVIRDKRVLHLIGEYLRRGAMVEGRCKPAWKARRKAGRYRRCWRTSTWMTWIRNWIGGGIATAGMRTTATLRWAVRPRRNARWPRDTRILDM